MAFNHNPLTNEVTEVANRFFDKMIYLKIKNNGISLADIEKTVSFFIIANNPNIFIEELIGIQTNSTPRPMIDYHVGFVAKGLGELKSLGLVSQQNNQLSITQLGRDFYSFLHDKSKVEQWLGSLRYPEGSDEIQITKNITKLRIFIDSEENLIRNNLKQYIRPT